jgi:hypothetical protein
MAKAIAKQSKPMVSPQQSSDTWILGCFPDELALAMYRILELAALERIVSKKVLKQSMGINHGR